MSARKALHRMPRATRVATAQLLVGHSVTVEIEHARDGAVAKWSGDLLAVADQLSTGADSVVLRVDDDRVVCISLATVAKISEKAARASRHAAA